MPHPVIARGTTALYRTRQRLRAASPRARRRNERYLRAIPALPIPLPPASMVLDVAGSLDARWFLEGGRLAFDSIQAALLEQDVDIEGLDAVLDFGCGCGRVLRHWPRDGGISLHGTDSNPALIRWCEQHLPFATVQTNAIDPPLGYPGERFSLVYALSVFTHLPERMQMPWLSELERVLKPGGLLLLTVHGTAYLPRLTSLERQRFQAGEIVVRNDSVPGSNDCSAFHPDEYLKSTFGTRMRLLSHARQAARGNPIQDVVLLQKPDA